MPYKNPKSSLFSLGSSTFVLRRDRTRDYGFTEDFWPASSILQDNCKILAQPEPPGYRLKEPCAKMKIGGYLERIAQVVEIEKALPKKQRHKAKRICAHISGRWAMGGK
jgi:hypothetical protein